MKKQFTNYDLVRGVDYGSHDDAQIAIDHLDALFIPTGSTVYVIDNHALNGFGKAVAKRQWQSPYAINL